jgi:hypothetical protein
VVADVCRENLSSANALERVGAGRNDILKRYTDVLCKASGEAGEGEEQEACSLEHKFGVERESAAYTRDRANGTAHHFKTENSR